jgi:hypothetical protein
LSSWASVYRCCPLLTGGCPSSAGQPRATPRVRTTSAVSTRWTSTLVSASWTIVTCRVVTSTSAAEGGRPPASQPARDRARLSAAARPRGLRRTSTSSSPATSAAGLATVARAVLRRAVARVADLAHSKARPVGSGLSTIVPPSGSGTAGACRPRAWKARPGSSSTSDATPMPQVRSACSRGCCPCETASCR